MKILSRDSSAAKETSRKKGPGRQVTRRIEITVEREVDWVLVRRGPAEPEYVPAVGSPIAAALPAETSGNANSSPDDTHPEPAPFDTR